jgi:hypothetical protein
MVNGLVFVELERTSLCPIGILWITGKEEIQVLHSIKMFDDVNRIMASMKQRQMRMAVIFRSSDFVKV